MGYKHRQLANTLLHYPYLNKYINDVYTYYMLPENILYILSNKKNYKIEYEIMESLLQLFMSEVEHEKILSGSPSNIMNIMYKRALEISQELVRKLQKIYPEGDYSFLNNTESMPLKEQLVYYNKVITNINKTPKQFKFKTYDDMHIDYEFDFSKLRKYIKLFYYIVQLYENIYYSICEKEIKDNFGSYNRYLEYYYKFLTHFIISFKMDSLIECDNNIIAYTVYHLNRSERYLERAVVSIVKYIIGFIVENIKIENELMHQLLAIKQQNFFDISINTSKRIKDYIIWIQHFEMIYDKKNINYILDKITEII